jgi:MoaA/NifB/PqqE/SkfB family radical SAM enzyme
MDWLLHSIVEAQQQGAIFLDIMGLGEPTVINELPRILNTAASVGMVCTVGTNGTTRNLMDPCYLSRLFDASPIKFRVSLDGAEPGENDRFRDDPSTWYRVVNFLDSLLNAREKGKLKAGIFINKVLSDSNEKNLLQDLKFMAELGVDDIHLIPIRFASDQFFTPEKILRFNREIVPGIQELGKRYKLAWLCENAYLFGRSEKDIELASQGYYYRPTIAKECYVMKGQIVIDPRRLPYTCLWGRRAGGKPLSQPKPSDSNFTAIHDRVFSMNYPDLNPGICKNYCTRRVIDLNNCVARKLAEIPDRKDS